MSAADATLPIDANGGPTAADLAAGAAEAEAQRVAERDKPTRDPKPRKRAKRKHRSAAENAAAAGEAPPLRGAAAKAATRAESTRLEARLGELLAFPAVPAMMFLPDVESKAFMSDHFTVAGPTTAHELVVLSEDSPELRRILVRVTTGSSMFAVAFAVLGYAAPPVLWTLGMRQQAQRLAIVANGAAQVDPEQLARMMADYAGPPPSHEPGANGAPVAEGDGAERAAPAPGADTPQL